MNKPKHNAEQYPLPLKPKYSYSQVENAKCGAKHNFLKTLKTAREVTYNLASGTMLDAAFNAYYENNQHLVETHQQRLDYARAALTFLLQEHPEWYTMEWSKKAGDVRSSPENYVAWLFDHKALELVCRHDRGPVEVQLKVELELPNYTIVGYVDCLETDTGTVVDVKSVTGWGQTTVLQYALRSQIPLYRMILKDSRQLVTKGRYELLLCRKAPKLVSVDDWNIDFIQHKLVEDFDKHHQRLTTKNWCRNPEHCFDYNKPCQFFSLCWPELVPLIEQTK